MEDYIVFPLIFIESITMLLWLHISFRRSLGESNGKIYFVAIYVSYYIILTLLRADNYINIVGIFLIGIWVRLCFKTEVFSGIIRIIIAMLGMGLAQIISMQLLEEVNDYMKLWDLMDIYYVLGISCLIVSIVIYCVTKKNKHFAWRSDKYTVLVIVYIAIILMFIKYDYETKHETYNYMYIVLFLSLIILLIIIVKSLKDSNALEQKKLELELVRRYEKTYKLLLSEMRRKQHDYKNQLIALTSIGCGVDALNDEIKDNYAKELLKEDLYTTIMGGCDNPVLAGYLYTKCMDSERKGVTIVPKITLSSDKYKIPLHEIIEILGILLDNAIEYLQTEEVNCNAVYARLYNDNGVLHINTSNVSRYYSYEEISRLFELGYSDKGLDRGVGLYSLKNIVDKYKGELMVENIERDNENYLEFKIKI